MLAKSKLKGEMANRSYERLFQRQLGTVIGTVVLSLCADCESQREDCQFNPCPRARKITSLLAELLTIKKIGEN